MDQHNATPEAEAGAAVADLRSQYDDVFVDLVTYDEARQVLGGISRWSISRHIRERTLTAVAVNGRRFITKASLTAYIDELRRASIRPVEPSPPRARRRTA